MTREQAIQIATNFYQQREGEAPQGMIVKRMEPAGGHITILTDGYDVEKDINFNYEIEIDPISDSVTMKRILAEYKASDFTTQPCKLSSLKQGDLFRNEIDCVVYEFHKPMEYCGDIFYGICREGKSDLNLVRDRMVYPCGK